MRSIIKFTGKFPVIVANRIVLFFFLMCLFTGFLYVLGTVQGFMDDTQFILLGLARTLGILLASSSFFTIILSFVFYLISKKLRYLGGVLLHAFFGFFGVGLTFVSSFIVVISGGIAG